MNLQTRPTGILSTPGMQDTTTMQATAENQIVWLAHARIELLHLMNSLKRGHGRTAHAYNDALIIFRRKYIQAGLHIYVYANCINEHTHATIT